MLAYHPGGMAVALRRDSLRIPLILLGAAAFGALVTVQPQLIYLAIGGAALVALTFAFPVTHFCLLLVFTVIVPYQLENQYGIGGGAGAAGLIISDVFLFSGIARGVYATLVSRIRLRPGEILALGLVVVYVSVVTLQFIRGVALEGYGLSQAGDEWRSLIGVAALVSALPLLRERDSQERLLKGLLVFGLLLGVWGLAQWILQLSFVGDSGIRTGIAGTSGSVVGQLQGGLYGYPVAVTLSFAALMSGIAISQRARLLLTVSLVINGISLLLTFERTFWLTTILACGMIILRAGRAQRLRALIAAPIALVAVLAVASVAVPGVLTAARERLLSIGSSARSSSVQYRVIESQHLATQIKHHPVAGSGVGAAMWWGRPASGVPPTIEYFAHNGPLWIWWKLGLAGLVLIFGGIVMAVLRRGRAEGSPLFGMVSVGAQGALLALLLTNVTFPSVTARTITPTIGLLLAISCLPRASYAVSSARARSGWS